MTWECGPPTHNKEDNYCGKCFKLCTISPNYSYADHGFVDGDQVTYEAQAGVAKISGLVSGQTYLVTNTTGTTQFGLTDLDGNAVSYGQASANTDHGTGVGAKFHLASLAGAPTVGEAGTTAPTSEVLKTEDLTIHGYVGSTTVQLQRLQQQKLWLKQFSQKV